jgi:transcriptional regulator with XRE-family HTH domain
MYPLGIIVGIIMIIKTRIFELYARKYKNLSELAQAMGISVSQVYRVRKGKRNINQKFLIGSINAFPEYKLDELFYLAPELPSVINKSLSSRFSRQASSKGETELVTSTGKVYISSKEGFTE